MIFLKAELVTKRVNNKKNYFIYFNVNIWNLVYVKNEFQGLLKIQPHITQVCLSN